MPEAQLEGPSCLWKALLLSWTPGLTSGPGSPSCLPGDLAGRVVGARKAPNRHEEESLVRGRQQTLGGGDGGDGEGCPVPSTGG